MSLTSFAIVLLLIFDKTVANFYVECIESLSVKIGDYIRGKKWG